MQGNRNTSTFMWLFAILIALFIGFGGGYYILKNYDITPKAKMVHQSPILQSPPVVPSPSTTRVTSYDEDDSPSINIKKPKPFKYTAISPIKGKLKAVIELGADGFNYFVIKADRKQNWKKVKYKWGLSLLEENESTPVNPEEILNRIKNSIGDIQRKTKTKPDSIHFLISSGAQNLPIGQEILQVVESRYTVEKITKEREGKFAFYATVPRKFRKNSFVIDIGSGNTKIAWLDNNNKLITTTTYGAKYYKHDYDNAEVYDNVKIKAKEIPNNRRKHAFIIGGAPYKLAKKTKKTKKERYTVLYYPEDYLKNAKHYGLKLEGSDNGMAKGKIEGGLTIYKAIFDETQTKQFIFDWDANFTIGYLVRRQ